MSTEEREQIFLEELEKKWPSEIDLECIAEEIYVESSKKRGHRPSEFLAFGAELGFQKLKEKLKEKK